MASPTPRRHCPPSQPTILAQSPLGFHKLPRASWGIGRGCHSSLEAEGSETALSRASHSSMMRQLATVPAPGDTQKTRASAGWWKESQTPVGEHQALSDVLHQEKARGPVAAPRAVLLPSCSPVWRGPSSRRQV